MSQTFRGTRSRELWLWFVALLVRQGCLTHLIVLRFADAFFEHLRTLAPSLSIFIFSERVCCLPSGRARHRIPTLRFGYGFIKSSTGIRPAKRRANSYVCANPNRSGLGRVSGWATNSLVLRAKILLRPANAVIVG